MNAATEPLVLPPNFDPIVGMLGREQDGEILHPTPYNATFAAQLLANGTAVDIKLAEKVIVGILRGQELDENDPHCGGFRFQIEEPLVDDLNIVQFVLGNLTPLMIEFGDRLSRDTYERTLHSIKLGMMEICRIDVGLVYSNIVAEDITNSCLGGQLLGDDALVERGKEKFRKWMDFTDRSGGIIEFNSVSYTQKIVESFSKLAKLTTDQEIRTRAEVVLARMGINGALHIHPATGRWVGPHSRAYYPTIAGQEIDERGGADVPRRSEAEIFDRWLERGMLPGWLADALRNQPDVMSVRETTDLAAGIGTSSYLAPTYAMGVATRELSSQANRFIAWQSNVFTFHYTRPDSDRPGSVFSKYVHDELWMGDFETAPARKSTGAIVSQPVFPDEGRFIGHQDANRALALYTSERLGALNEHRSAKAMIVWPRWGAPSDEIWIGGEQVKTLPATVPKSSTVVVASGDAMLAIRPLDLTDLGRDAPIRFIEKNGFLIMEMYNYLGTAKTFWELAWPGGFFQGRPRCGFYAEAASRNEYSSPADLLKAVESGDLADFAEPPFTYDGNGQRKWTVEYKRDGRILGVEADLMDWDRPVRRWNHDGDQDWPMFDSPVAKESRNGHVAVGDAELSLGSGIGWLFASPEAERWVAAHRNSDETSFKLSVPGGEVEIESFGIGIVEWDAGKVRVSAYPTPSEPKVSGGVLVEMNRSNQAPAEEAR